MITIFNRLQIKQMNTKSLKSHSKKICSYKLKFKSNKFHSKIHTLNINFIILFSLEHPTKPSPRLQIFVALHICLFASVDSLNANVNITNLV